MPPFALQKGLGAMTRLAQTRGSDVARFERVESIAAVRDKLAAWRAAGQRISLVPTMGNLHAGHLSLIETAQRHADRVVTSIFVNPKQFGPGEDIDAYPRTPAEDIQSLEAQGIAELVFAPSVSAVYPRGTVDTVGVTLPPLADDLCGRSRPGHFDGVASVVLRLLHIIEPDVLVLGRKDYQQLVLVSRMLEEMHIDVELVSAPTVREADGLAMSSRNVYLTATERSVAPQLFAELSALADSLRRPDESFEPLRARAIANLESTGFSVDYLELRNASDLGAVSERETISDRVLLVAAWLGRARLIDNVVV
jgi:pantoate--beta-alanine ligase